MLNFSFDMIRPCPIRGNGFLFRKLLPASGTRRARVFGYEVELDLSDTMQRSIYIGFFKRIETSWIRGLLRPGMTFVDAGANIGYYALLAASKVGRTGKVIAFEPNPRLNRKTAQWARHNHIQQMQVHDFGLSDANGSLTLHLPPSGFHNENATMLTWDGLPGWDRVEVPVVRLDGMLSKLGVRTVDVLKIDVEGHEPKVFEGLGGRLADGSVERILCEFNDPALKESGSSSESLRQMLLDRGYKDITPTAWKPNSWLQNRLFLHRRVR